jgi:hypothetical protein
MGAEQRGSEADAAAAVLAAAVAAGAVLLAATPRPALDASIQQSEQVPHVA